MLLSSYRGSPAGARRPAHVIVVGNEKGGSGKSTTAMHVAVALLKLGCSVATVDLGFLEVVFCSIEMAGEKPSICSTSGFCIISRNWRA